MFGSVASSIAIAGVSLTSLIAETGIFDMPVREIYRQTSAFGLRTDPMTGAQAMHQGVDLAAKYGASVHSSADGRIVVAEERLGYGLMVEIDHGDGWRTRYAHLSKVYAESGSYVRRGDVIGAVGGAGVNPHLHFELQHAGEQVDPGIYIETIRLRTNVRK